MRAITAALFFICINFSMHASTLQQIPGPIGVEIYDMDLSQGITTNEVQWIKQLLNDRLVVIIRNQNLTAKQQSLITSQFGDMEIAWNKKNRHPEECHLYVSNNQGAKRHSEYTNPTVYWHWDKSFIQYASSVCFAFYPSKPQPEGLGATGFLNAYLIYETLPKDLKDEIEHLSIAHSYMSLKRIENYQKFSLDYTKESKRYPEVIHPLVGIHPITGKKVLNIDELAQGKIVGMDEIESAEIIKRLFDHAMEQKGFYYHVWKTGDFVIWDNLALLHKRTPNDISIPRILHRTNVSGRSDIEGRCFLIASDLSYGDLIKIGRKLFDAPLILDTDSYEDLNSLEADVQLLRKGFPIQNIPPHAIVILIGEKWKESKKLISYLHATLLKQIPEEIFFSYKTKMIQYSDTCGEELQNICLKHYLIQDAHERLLSGEQSLEYLNKKLKLFTSSNDTYVICDKRKEVHVKILTRAFEHTLINKTEDEWFKCLEKKLDINKQMGSELVLFYGGEDSRKKDFLNGFQNGYVKINNQLFFDFLFQSVPYEHKEKLWAYISEESEYLTQLIAKIAMAHQIPIVIDTDILSNHFIEKVADTVREYGGQSTIVYFDSPFEINYTNLVFRKLFALHWNKFVSHFDTSFLIGSNNNPITFLTEKEGFSLEELKPFLGYGCIDPEELTDELACLDPEKRASFLREHLQQIPDQKISELLTGN